MGVFLAVLMLFLDPVDPQHLHPGAGHGAFHLTGYDFSRLHVQTETPVMVRTERGGIVHLSFQAPFTGRCEVFELVNNQGVKNVAFPWGNGEGGLAIKGHKIRVEVTLHSDAELRANGMSRPRIGIGMDCWKFHDEDHAVVSTIYRLKPGAKL